MSGPRPKTCGVNMAGDLSVCMAGREMLRLRGGEDEGDEGDEEEQDEEDNGIGFRSRTLLESLQKLKKEIQEAQVIQQEKLKMQEKMKSSLDFILEEIEKEWRASTVARSSSPMGEDDRQVVDETFSKIFGNFYTPTEEIERRETKKYRKTMKKMKELMRNFDSNKKKLCFESCGPNKACVENWIIIEGINIVPFCNSTFITMIHKTSGMVIQLGEESAGSFFFSFPQPNVTRSLSDVHICFFNGELQSIGRNGTFLAPYLAVDAWKFLKPNYQKKLEMKYADLTRHIPANQTYKMAHWQLRVTRCKYTGESHVIALNGMLASKITPPPELHLMENGFEFITARGDGVVYDGAKLETIEGYDMKRINLSKKIGLFQNDSELAIRTDHKFPANLTEQELLARMWEDDTYWGDETVAEGNMNTTDDDSFLSSSELIRIEEAVEAFHAGKPIPHGLKVVRKEDHPGFGREHPETTFDKLKET